MATCQICNKKLKMFFNGSMELKNGHVCADCAKKVFTDFDTAPKKQKSKWADNHIVSDFKDLLENKKKINLENYYQNQKQIAKEKEKEYLKILVHSSQLYCKKFRFDNKDRKIIVDNGIDKQILNYDDLVKFDPIEDFYDKKKQKHTLVRATVGGLLFNGAGAIVGALSGHDKNVEYVKKLGVSVYFKNHNAPYTAFAIYSPDKEEKVKDHQKDIKEYNDLISELNSVLQSQSQATYNESHSEAISTNDNDDINQLKQLKSLVDQGVLTQEEFEAKKKQILGL